eukprot:8309671-Pyramimonas_sp.AAC.1
MPSVGTAEICIISNISNIVHVYFAKRNAGGMFFTTHIVQARMCKQPLRQGLVEQRQRPGDNIQLDIFCRGPDREIIENLFLFR